MPGVAQEQTSNDRTLVAAVNAAIERVEYHLSAGDNLMADVAGAIVRKLLSHPVAGFFAVDIEWRRMLARWEKVRTQLGAPPLMLADLIDHHAMVLLVEAAREAEQPAAS